MKIEVLVDIYRNVFPNSKKSEEMYCYGNIRAINEKKQEELDKCIQEMIDNDSELLHPSMRLDVVISVPQHHITAPLETDRKCIFNTETKKFEFKSRT